jgi:hypothetical protein
MNVTPTARIIHLLTWAAALLLFTVPGALAETPQPPCAPPAGNADFESRFGRAPSARRPAQLAALLENPSFMHAGATRADGTNGATVDVMTESHVVFPVRVADLIQVFSEDAPMTEYMPNLAVHEVVCRPAPNVSRHRQRVDFGPIIFSLGTEYVIDVHYLVTGPEVFASRWTLVDSVDGRLAYNLGSWYFESVQIDGHDATYVRHYARTGLTTRVPGVRFFANRRAAGGVEDVLDAAYNEAVRRFGKTFE